MEFSHSEKKEHRLSQKNIFEHMGWFEENSANKTHPVLEKVQQHGLFDRGKRLGMGVE